MRYSRQREALLNLLLSTKIHPDAEWLYTKLREEDPHISLGTVYRNLRQMAENGDIIKLSVGNTSHFDGCLDEHYHLYCTNCNKIIDIPPKSVSVSVKENADFGISGFALMLEGICKDCREKTQA